MKLSLRALPAEMINPARLDKWLLECCRREGVDQLAVRKIRQFGPACLRDQSTLDSAVSELTELGRVKTITEGKRKLVQVNPALLRATA